MENAYVKDTPTEAAASEKKAASVGEKETEPSKAPRPWCSKSLGDQVDV